ncbi:PQQ-binding-like beta-propeller repeat protein [Halolamina salifodinae]|uniref:Pyrrolo-quinoline quinone repeat domain-containing protein n=1 Tax=Halolamina salifodinae TaxID=1202767 RepID=A0A8T4GY74_9EURY|nr:PQQ-binding-like beta-propeller repeat protein [Halolamina salifodinae]MBP1987987.1 hypothetical protein [Halolamina salifodinae]
MPSISRRRYLTGAATGALAATAGCLFDSCSPVDPGTAWWPQTRGDAGNTNAAPTLPAITDGEERWTVATEAADLAGVAAVGDVVVAAGATARREAGVLAALDLDDEETRTAYELDRPATGTPALDRGVAVVPVLGSFTDPETGGLVAVDLSESTEPWRHGTAGRPNPPAVHGGAVVASSDAGDVTALDGDGGEVRWRRSFGDDRQRARIPAPPAVDGERVYLSAEGSAAEGIYALDRGSGETAWSIPGPSIPHALVRAADLVLASYRRYEVAAFDAGSGERRWSQPIHGGRLFPPAVAEGRVISAGRERVVALSLADGGEQWTRAYSVSGAPLLVGSTVILPTRDGLVGLDAASGDERWSADGTPGTGYMPVENGLLSTDGDSVSLRTNCG